MTETEGDDLGTMDESLEKVRVRELSVDSDRRFRVWVWEVWAGKGADNGKGSRQDSVGIRRRPFG